MICDDVSLNEKMNNLTEFVLNVVGRGTSLWNSGQKNGSESETSQRNPRGEGTTAAREDETVIIVYIYKEREFLFILHTE